MLKNSRYILIIFIFLNSCGLFNGGKKDKNQEEIMREKMPIAQAIDSLKMRGKNIKNFEGTFNLLFKKGKDEHELKGQVKIEKGKYIWLNLLYFGISVARVQITPNKFRLFEKLGNSYIDKELDYILKVYAPLLTYKSMENIFLGTDVTMVLEGKYNIENKPYRQFLITNIKSNKNQADRSILVYKSEIMNQKMKDSRSEINIGYIGLDENKIPNKIKSLFKKGSLNIVLDIEYLNVKINQQNINSPYSVPEGFEPMDI